MFDRIRYKALAKERLTHHWSYLAGLTLIVLLLSSVSMLFSWIPLIGIIISIFIAAPLSMSLNMIVKKLFLKEDIAVNSVLEGFSLFGKTIALELWITLFIMLWSLLLIVPGIIKSYSYRLAFYCLMDDPNLSPKEAIQKSMRLTVGHKFDFFVLDLSWIGWAFVATFTCGIGSLFLIPYTRLTDYIAYRAISEQSLDLSEEETFDKETYTL